MPPSPTADWTRVLAEARMVLNEYDPITRPQLWDELVRRGAVAPHLGDGFRAAVAAAQVRGRFPGLPRGKPGPPKGQPKWHEERPKHKGGVLRLRTWANGTTWWYADCYVGGERVVERLGLADSDLGLTRAQAEEALHELACHVTPLELYTERLDACCAVLGTLSGIHTVRLSPSGFAVFAANGYGEEIVMRAVRTLVGGGLADLRWEVSGMDRVPVVQPAAA